MSVHSKEQIAYNNMKRLFEAYAKLRDETDQTIPNRYPALKKYTNQLIGMIEKYTKDSGFSPYQKYVLTPKKDVLDGDKTSSESVVFKRKD